MKGFSAHLKEARKGLGLTQEQLGAALEVRRETINTWERNKHKPSLPHAIRCQEVMKTLEAKEKRETQG